MKTAVVKFSLGEVVVTPDATDALHSARQKADAFLRRHARGDWGEVCKEEWRENELSLSRGDWLISCYRTRRGDRIWVYTEDKRSYSIVMTPIEF